MSPPATNSAMNGEQEAVAKYIGDLDSARLPNHAVNRDINPQFRMRKTASEEKHEEELDSDEKGFLLTENEGFIYNTNGSPPLCPGQEVISCLSGNEDSASNSLDISSPAKCLPKSWRSSGKGKKRKKPKSGYKKRSHKRQKVDVTTSAAHQQHKIIETAGGRSSKTSSKAGCKPAQQPLAGLSNGGMCCLRIHGQRCGGGGGGDDGDGRPPKKPLEEVKCGHAGKQKPKKKKPAEAEEQPEVNTTTNNMVVDEQNDSSEEIRDVEMVSQHVQQNTAAQVQPEQSNPQTQTEELLTQAHVRINHYTFCKKLKASCERCQKVEAIIHHFFEEMHGTCVCRKCQLWSHVLKYHTPKCKHKNSCKVCMSASQIGQETTAPQPQVAVEQENFATCRASLDEDEQVVWKNPDIPNLTHFKEDQDYIIDKDNFYRKGGHGTVCKVVIPDHVKKKYFGSTSREFVMKEAKEFGEDEMCVFRDVWRHPNFVQTFVVVKKMNVEQPYRILMEKCEMSLKDYLNQLLNQNKRMSIDEAMFYWTQIFDAIKHLHFMRIGVIHKDVKAENVLLTIAENFVRVKLADFDTVKLLHNEYTIPGLTAKGTLGLISLQVLKREPHGRPADVWNMAMFLFQLLFPIEFSAFQKKVQPSKKEDLHMFIPRYESLLKEFLAKTIPKLKQVDEDLGDLIERCLSEDPLDRPTAVEVLENRAVVKYVCRKIDMGELIGKICPDWKQ